MDKTLHQYLKESTRQRHEQAEQHPFQGELAQGRLPRDGYSRYLVQLAHLHKRFEDKLRQAESDPKVSSVVKDEHYQLSFLEDDLQALKTSPDSEAALPCIEQFAALPEMNSDPCNLLGPLYVLLGSKHGGRFIAHQVKQAYGLTDGGFIYFNPYGESFKELWQNFTAALNALPQDPKLQQGVLKAADATFEVFVNIGDGIWKSQATYKGSRA